MSERLRDYFYRFRKLLKRGGNWLMWVYVVVLIFVAAGSVSALIEGSRWGPDVLIITSRSAETGLEALIFGISVITGFLGVFLIHRGTSTSSKRVANMYILGGLALLAVGMAISGWLTYLKA